MLVLPVAVRSSLGGWARAAYPEEACGLLLGALAGGRGEVSAARSARNLNRARARDRYELDPLDLLAADEEARRTGADVIGVWHSHPDHPARPSETDRAAAWEGWSYVILAVERGEVRDLRSFRLEAGGFVEEDVTS